MHLTMNFQTLKINLTKFRQTLHETLSEKLAEACRVWLTAVITESTRAGLPVWSAASIATLSPLASHVAYALMLMPASGAPDRVTLGLANGVGLFEPGTQQPGLYTFTYETTLKHLIINESYDATQWGFHLKNPGPYHFQLKGEYAFRSFASTVVLPGWDSILDVSTIVVG